LFMRILTLLMIYLLLTNCSQGWSVGGVQVTPSDTVANSVFIEVMDVDSVIHWYHGTINNQTNWCYKHDEWEEIRIK